MIKKIRFASVYYTCFSIVVLLKIIAHFIESIDKAALSFKEITQQALYFFVIIQALREFVFFYKALDDKNRNQYTIIIAGIRFVVISGLCLLFGYLNTIF